MSTSRGPSDLNEGLIDPVGAGPGDLVPADGRATVRNAIGFTSTSTSRMTSPPGASTRRSPRAVCCSPMPRAPAFWVLADPEGNEACVCTWQGRD